MCFSTLAGAHSFLTLLNSGNNTENIYPRTRRLWHLSVFHTVKLLYFPRSFNLSHIVGYTKDNCSFLIYIILLSFTCSWIHWVLRRKMLIKIVHYSSVYGVCVVRLCVCALYKCHSCCWSVSTALMCVCECFNVYSAEVQVFSLLASSHDVHTTLSPKVMCLCNISRN